MTDEELNELENIAKAATQGTYEKGALVGSINCGKRHIAMINFYDTLDEEQRVTREQTNANQEYFISFNPSNAIRLINELKQVKKERAWLAEQMKSCIELHCPYRTTSIPSEPCYVGYASKKECWLKAAKEATK